jgi:hypothetical protein
MKHLTGNELATAWFATLHAISWCKAQKPQSAYFRKERLKFEALRDKLSAISDYAYPYVQKRVDESIPDHGDEKLMRMDAAVAKRTRKAAQRFNRSA